MSKSATFSVKLSQQVKDRLKAIAEEKNQSENEVVASFVEASVDAYDWKAAIIKDRLAKADAGGPWVSDESFKRWLRSWGKENELPPPEATINS